MFEKIIEGILLQYFGDYVNNFDPSKMKIGLLSGMLEMENINLNSKKINEIKMPFLLSKGIILQLLVKIPWQTNFNEPTLIKIQGIEIELSIIPKKKWQFIDFYSYDRKISFVQNFFDSMIGKISNKLKNKNNNSLSYFDKIKIKILENLQISFTNIIVKIKNEFDLKKDLFCISVDEITITNESSLSSVSKGKCKIIKVKNFSLSSFEVYLIHPIGLSTKIKYKKEDDSQEKHFEVNLEVDKLNISFSKKQYDYLIILLNDITQYQVFQNYKKFGQKLNYYRPRKALNPKEKNSILEWWRFAIRAVIKRRKYYQGNPQIFDIDSTILAHYKAYFQSKFKNLKEENDEMLRRIVTNVDVGLLCEWCVDNIKEYFSEEKVNEIRSEGNKKFFTFFSTNSTSSSMTISKEEKEESAEVLHQIKTEIKEEIKKFLRNKICVFIQFNLAEGSLILSNDYKGIGMEYKGINFSFEYNTIQNVSKIESRIKLFVLFLLNSSTKFQLTVSKEKEAEEQEKNLFEFSFAFPNNRSETSKTKFYLFLAKQNLVYHQALLERLIRFIKVNKDIISEDLLNVAWEKYTDFKDKASDAIKGYVKGKKKVPQNEVSIVIEPRTITIPLNKYNISKTNCFIVNLGGATVKSIDNEDKYLTKLSSSDIIYKDLENSAFSIISSFQAEIDILIKSSISVSLRVISINFNLTEKIYYTLHFLKEILAPSQKENESWAILEQDTINIKKNAKVFAKMNKKDNMLLYDNFKEYFGVLSGGYIYFYNSIEDEDYDSFFYVKNANVSIDEENNRIKLWNKYGNVDIEFFSEKKRDYFYLGLIERINEINVELTSNENQKLKSTKHTEILDVEKVICTFEISVKELKFNLYSIKEASNKISTSFETSEIRIEKLVNIFTIKIQSFSLNVKIRSYDICLYFTIYSVELFDEIDKTNYKLLSSINPENTSQNILNISVIATNSQSPFYEKSNFLVSIEVGYLNSIWNPYRIRRLLFFLFHNEKLKRAIQDEVIGIPSEHELKKKKQRFENIEDEEKTRCDDDNNKEKSVMKIKFSFNKIKMIWVNPITMEPLGTVDIGHSRLKVDVAIDHFHIQGEFGQLSIFDSTNYPYGKNAIEEYSLTTIFSFESISFEFFSMTLSCPLLKDNFTSRIALDFKKVELNYIHELFFRMFNYFFDEFLNSMQPPLEIKIYKDMRKKFPIVKTVKNYEFINVLVTFSESKIFLSPRKSFKNRFIVEMKTIRITNSYELTKGRLRNQPNEERFLVKYSFEINNIVLTYLGTNVLSTKTINLLLALPIFFNSEEMKYTPNEIDKSFKICINIHEDSKLTINQAVLKFLIQCIDLNLAYYDSKEKEYQYQVYNRKFFGTNVDVKPSEIGYQIIQACIDVQIPRFSFEVESIITFVIASSSVSFVKKFTGPNELCIIFNSIFNDVDNPLVSSSTKTEIKIIVDKSGEKNFVFKVANVNILCRFDVIQSLINLFNASVPVYDPGDADLPNKYDPDIDNKPSIRVNIDVKNISIFFLTRDIKEKSQRIFCLSTNMYLLFKKQKIIQCKTELVNNYNLYSEKKLDKEIQKDYKEISNINISLYDIHPFICSLEEMMKSETKDKTTSGSKILNSFNMYFDFVNIMRYFHPEKFVVSSQSQLNLNEIIFKITYSDLVQIISSLNYNLKLLKNNSHSNHPIIQKKTLSRTSFIKSIDIDKGMGIDEIQCKSLKIILIDNHSNSYYPFLAFEIKTIKIINERLSASQNVFSGNFSFKIIIYNYFVGVWEPILERVMVSFETTNDSSDEVLSIKNVSIKIEEILNINISDSVIILLYNTLSSWTQKYSSALSSNQKLISNHTILNLTGRKMDIYYVMIDDDRSNTQNLKCKHIAVIKANEKYDLEYIDDESERIIAVAFNPLITINDIRKNTIKIDQLRTRKHNINYAKLLMQIPTTNELNKYQYIISEVFFSKMRKIIVISSPLVFLNKLQETLLVTLRKKKNSFSFVVPGGEKFGIPYEYFDANIEFKFNPDDQPQIFDVRTFVDKKKLYNEMRFDERHICFFGYSDKKVMHILISYPLIIWNYLPFDVSITIKENRYNIGKSKQCFVDIISVDDEIWFTAFSCNNIYSNRKPISVLPKNYYYDSLYAKEEDISRKRNFHFDLFDQSVESPIRVLGTILNSNTQNSTNNINIILHCTGIIYNGTSKDIKLLYINPENNRKTNIQGHNNIFIFSNQTKLIAEYKRGNENFISNPIPLKSFGIVTKVDLFQERTQSFITANGFSGITYEFTLESKLSVLNTKFDIYTSTYVLHPQYIISNKTINSLCVLVKGFEEPFLVQKGRSCPIFFLRDSNRHILIIQPLEDEGEQTGKKWNWSQPIDVEMSGIITVQIYPIKSNGKSKNRYINIEKVVTEFSTFYVLTEATLDNAEVIIDNTSHYVSMKIHQNGKELGAEFVPPNSKSIFALKATNAESNSKNLTVEFIYSSNVLCNSKNTKNFTFIKKIDGNNNTVEKIISNGAEKDFPLIEGYYIQKSRYTGYKVRLEISTDGVKKILKLVDDAEGGIAQLMHQSDSHTASINVIELNVKIYQLGISIISGKTSLMLKKKFRRKEIFYITLSKLHFFFRNEKVSSSKETKTSNEIQCKVEMMQVDNNSNYITMYPVVFHPINYSLDKKSKNSQPFFNIAASLYKSGIQDNEVTKFNYFNYLIQSFEISIDNEILDNIFDFTSNFMNNIDLKMNKDLYSIDSYTPYWLDSSCVSSLDSKIYFSSFETSPVEMRVSFSPGSSIEKYVTSNPLLGPFFTTIATISDAEIKLNGCIIHNLFISKSLLLMLVLNQYKQSLLTEFFSFFGASEILGNPLNLFKSLSLGVKDFFTKPIQGIVKGPLDGVEGAIEGGYSLIKHTIGGTFNATSNITSGISKTLLHLTKDENYIKKIRKDTLTKKPKNFVDGIGYGISSFANGVFHGVFDVVAKPIEETQKKGITGFGTGVVKGIGGLFSKPVVGVLQMISSTSEGIKNTFTNDDQNKYTTRIRKTRPFYGRNLYLKRFKSLDAEVIYFIMNFIIPNNNNEIVDSVKNFYFLDAIEYEKQNGEVNYFVWDIKGIFMINRNKKEILIFMPYENISEVKKEGDQGIQFYFEEAIAGKNKAVISVYDSQKVEDIIKISLKYIKENKENQG